MRILSSDLRKLVKELETGVVLPQALTRNFPDAFQWAPVDMTKITLDPYLFAGPHGEEMGIQVSFDGLKIGIWKPGDPEGKEVSCLALGLVFRFSIDPKTHLLKIESCKE